MKDFGDRIPVCFDIDDTVIPWENRTDLDSKDIVQIDCEGRVFQAQVQQKHVDNLIRHWQRNHVIVVWSAGGGIWAKAVVEALGIEDKVDIVMSKPSWYYDDKPCENWMGKRIYLYDEPGENS